MATKGTKGKTKPLDKEKPQPTGKGHDKQFDNLAKALDKMFGKKGDGSNRVYLPLMKSPSTPQRVAA